MSVSKFTNLNQIHTTHLNTYFLQSYRPRNSQHNHQRAPHSDNRHSVTTTNAKGQRHLTVLVLILIQNKRGRVTYFDQLDDKRPGGSGLA